MVPRKTEEIMATETPTDPQKGVLLLTQLMAQLMRQINEFLAEQANEREATRQQLRDLQERITSLQTTLGATPQASTSSASTSPLLVSVSPPSTSSQTKKVKATLPDPEKFDGTLWKFPGWLLEMQNKLRTDGTVFGCPKAQFAYIFSRLDHNPKALATSFAQEGGPGGTFDPDAFLAYLSFCYGNPHSKRLALARLGDLKQGERESFATFFPKFEKELADSGGLAWTDAVQIDFLQRSLNQEMRNLLQVQIDMPTDYRSYVGALRTLDTNLYLWRYDIKRSGRSPRTWSNSPDPVPARRKLGKRASSPPRNAMDLESAKMSRVVQHQNKEALEKRENVVDKEELDSRDVQGRCYRCGRMGCRAARCPLSPPKKSQQATKVRGRRMKPVLVAAVDEDET